MARPLRISSPGAFYHVMARGNAKATIFLDPVEYRAFLGALARALRRYGAICHTFCVMPTHYHLVLETPNGHLSETIQYLNSIYARWWNARHGRCGHVFQGRFKAQLVQDGLYFRTLCRYVVRNPVRGGLVSDPADWPWSSYRAHVGLERPLRFLCSTLITAEMGSERATGPGCSFRDFVLGPFGDVRVEAAIRRDDRWLGDDNFLEEARLSAGRGQPRGISRREFLPTAPPLSEIIDARSSLIIRNRQIWRAHHVFGYRGVEIASYLGLHKSTLSEIIRAARRADAAERDRSRAESTAEPRGPSSSSGDVCGATDAGMATAQAGRGNP